MTVLETLTTRGDTAHTFGPPTHLTTTETDTALLFFLGERVYKFKKPVRLGCVDLTTREARLAVCEAEVRLNRRLAPDVYLGVADIRDAQGQLRDHMVVMRRLEETDRLSALLRRGDAVDEPLRQIARRLADFHARCETGPAIARTGGQANLQALWLAALAGISPYRGVLLDPADLDEIGKNALGYLASRGPLFAERARAGWVREGHGDLVADDIYLLPDGPRVLGCVEHDLRRRAGDVLGDVAALAADLEHLGLPDAAARFFRWYGEFSGETHPASLLHLYIAYHTLRRALAACIRHDRGDPDAAGDARRLVDLSLSHLRHARLRLVLASGRSDADGMPLADQAATDGDGRVLLRFRHVLTELAEGLDPAAHTAREGGPLTSDEVYDELLRRARRTLEHGENVVLDAAWADRRHRALAAKLAESVHADLVELTGD